MDQNKSFSRALPGTAPSSKDGDEKKGFFDKAWTYVLYLLAIILVIVILKNRIRLKKKILWKVRDIRATRREQEPEIITPAFQIPTLQGTFSILFLISILDCCQRNLKNCRERKTALYVHNVVSTSIQRP